MTSEDGAQGLRAALPDVVAPVLPAKGSERPAPGSNAKTHARTIEPGFILQHYEIIRPLGSGGMGAVFLARDLRLGRRVAIKLLLRHSGKGAARFLVEARATARINHESIVVVHELGDHLGTPYMVLEHLEGRTLQQLLQERQTAPRAEDRPEPETRVDAVGTADLWARGDPATDGSNGKKEPSLGTKAPSGFPPERAVALMLPVVRALVCAHEHGLVHLDLKPSNIMVTNTGVVKVLDFGIARIVDPPDVASTDGYVGEPVIVTSGRAGTMPYMSPEQWNSGPVTHRSDIWAVGIVLAELHRHRIRRSSTGVEHGQTQWTWHMMGGWKPVRS
jgi:serine/threonine protein kinase